MSSLPISIPVALIDPNPRQPRRGEDPEHIRTLADSILEHGMQQYPKGRKVGQRVQLAYGNSRLAAHKLLVEEGHMEFCTMAVILQDLTDLEMFTLAIVENNDRQDLNAIEEARSMQTLLDEFDLSRSQVAKLYRTTFNTVSQRLKLLELDPEIQRYIAEGRLPASPKTTTAWLSIPDREARLALAKRKAETYRGNDGSRRTYRTGASIEGIVASCKRLVESLMDDQAPRPEPDKADPNDPPSVALAVERAGRTPNARLRPSIRVIQEAALLACNRCTIRPADVAEPAWTLITQMAGDVCDECDARAARVEAICRECPAVDLLSRIAFSGDPNNDPYWKSRKKNGGKEPK